MDIHSYVLEHTTPVDDCLVWTTTQTGYVRVWYQGRYSHAHRLSYELHFGPIPDGMQVDHVAARGCRYKGCANPEHLEAVPQRVNLERAGGFTEDRCARGHRYEDVGWHDRPDGSRACRQCGKDRSKAYRSGLTLRQADEAGFFS